MHPIRVHVTAVILKLRHYRSAPQAWREETSSFDPETWDHLSQEEEMAMQKYYQERAQEICKTTLHLPSKAGSNELLPKLFQIG